MVKVWGRGDCEEKRNLKGGGVEKLLVSKACLRFVNDKKSCHCFRTKNQSE